MGKSAKRTRPDALPPEKAQREGAVELLRIYACVMVVWAHIQRGITHPDGTVNMVALTIKALIGDNVPLFFLIMGFFLFRGVEGPDRLEKIPGVHRKRLRGFLTRTYIPSVLTALLACFAGEFFLRNKSFAELFTRPGMDWKYLTSYVLRQAPVDMVGQFWYIVVQFGVLIFFPLLALLCAEQYTRLRRVYMGLSFLRLVLTDLAFLCRSEVWLQLEKYVFNEYVLYVLLGYELSVFFRKTTLSRGKQIGLSLGMFLTGVCLRVGLSLWGFSVYAPEMPSQFMVLQASCGYISSAGCFMLFYSVFRGFRSRVVTYLGALTLYVFLFHGMTLRLLAPVGTEIVEMLAPWPDGAQCLLYYLLYGGVVIGGALVMGVPAKFLYDAACRSLTKRLGK